jgi:hypothetical protein
MQLVLKPLVYPAPPAPLLITGDPDSYLPDVAYEYRFDVTGAIGKASAVKTSGTLPSGHQLYYDNFNDEVVVKWPAAAAGATPNQNLSFENAGGWVGPQWTIDNSTSYAGGQSAKFLGAGRADFVNNTVEIDGTTVVTATCRVAQGASSANAVRAAIGVRAFTPTGTVDFVGNFVVSSNPNWQLSSITAALPAGTTAFALFIRGERFRGKDPLWVDAVTCDYTTAVGTGSVDDIPLSFRVTDSAGRTADWSGVIPETIAAGTYVEYLPVAISQHSFNGVGVSALTLATARDTNVTPATGTITNGGASVWIQVDLGSAKEVCTVTLGTGTIEGLSVGGWMARGGRIEWSANGTTGWTQVTDCYQYTAANDLPVADFDIHFAPATARYWRVSRVDGTALRTSTFRLWGYLGGLVSSTFTVTQSSAFGGLTGTFANLGEVPNNIATGAATNNGPSEWIQVDLGSVKQIKRVVLSGGTLPGWGAVGAYLIPSDLTTSSDAVTWSTPQNVVGQFNDLAPTEHGLLIDVTARYVRLHRAGYLATTAFRVYTLP